MPIKGLYCSCGNFISKGHFTLNHIDITNDGTRFSFPENSSVNHLMSVRLNKQMSYDDVSFRFRLKLTNVTTSSKVGVLLKSATDGYDGERAMFVVGGGKISFYYGNTKHLDFADFDLTTLNDKDITFEMRRLNDYYYFHFQGQVYERRIKGDGSVFRQDIQGCIYGSDVTVEIKQGYYYSSAPDIKFGLVGDSIANGYSSNGGGWEDTIKGINLLEKGLAFGEFAGSANVIKDSLDSFSNIAIIKPKYLIILYGHNDTLFATGRLESDYRMLLQQVKNYGIIPVICAIPYSAWIDTTIPNTFIIDNFFNDDYITIDLRDTLTYPADYRDIAHPNVTGNRKLAEAIYEAIKDLP
jgi:lysophospholipase L1-like esterase